MRGRSAQWFWWVGGAVVLVVAAVVAIAVWPSPKAASSPPPRARVYNAFTVCLLTGPQGIAAGEAAPVWAGVRQAADTLNDQAQYLAAVASPETVGSVTPFVNTLIQQRCGLVVAVGPAEVSAVEAVAPGSPHTRFMVVGGGSASSNVQVVADPATDAVAAAVRAAAVGG